MFVELVAMRMVCARVGPRKLVIVGDLSIATYVAVDSKCTSETLSGISYQSRGCKIMIGVP